jgi:DNA modification methylase
VQSHWKPILWYVQGTYTGTYVGDLVRSADAPDKRFHAWGQFEDAMALLVKRFTAPVDTILDPLCGGGTTGAVAVALRRRFIGMDVDPAAIAITRARLSDLVAHES